MYFGYETMWTLTFVPVAFVLVMAVGIALAFVYTVGTSRGASAARRYTLWCARLLAAGMIADVAYAFGSGQFAAFLRHYGWTPLFEMGLLGVMFIGAMLVMAMSYLGSKKS